MATENQTAANQLNAQKGTGPKSAEGKATSAQNALKTGLYAKSEVIATESRDDYEALIAEYHARFNPATPEERALVDDLIRAEWLSRRYMAATTAIWDFDFRTMKEQDLGLTFLRQSEAFCRAQRCITASQRNFANALKQLRAIQAKRTAQPSDGRPDIVTSLAAHGPGLAWFEQNKDGSFGQHTIMRAPADVKLKDEVAFTELHAMTMTDVDGDGLQDIVTGKRWWSHGYRYDEENDLDDPPVLYWFKLVRGPNGQATFEPHLIDNRSGVGVQVVAADVDGDGKPDIVTSARKGTFIFYNRTH